MVPFKGQINLFKKNIQIWLVCVHKIQWKNKQHKKGTYKITTNVIP